MLIKPSSCMGCPLYLDGRGFSRPEGKYPSSTGVLIIGEALGSSEVMDALPFRPYAEAGSVLNTAFRFLGYDRSQFILWNEIACQPPFNRLENTAYEYEAINHCKVHFQQVVDKYKPKAILALGNVPLKHLWSMPQEIQDYIESLPETNKEEKDIKKKYLKNFKIGSMRGYVLPSIYGIPMIASFHPSYINMDKGRTHLGTLMRDLQAIVSVARTGKPAFKTVYDEDPTEEKVKDFYNYCKANPNLVIAHDIETPMTTLQIDESEIEYENVDVRDIDSVQFSVKEGTGIFIPYYGDVNIETIKNTLSLPNPKIGWNNWKFDEVNLEYHHGKDSIRGQVHDIMWMWKWLNQDFVKTGRALQFATNFFAPDFPVWKHLAQLEPKNYGCLHSESRVALSNGKYERIVDIIKNKKSILIKGMDENGSIINTRIVAWRKIRVPNQSWLKLFTDATDQPIYCTPDHEIWIDGIGWKSANTVIIGEQTKIPRNGNVDIFHGTILGDGTVDKRGRLSFQHCLDQESWFRAKQSSIDAPVYILSPQEVQISHIKTKRGKTFRTELWIGKEWRNKFYSVFTGNKRFIPPSDKALAIWYGDDGTLAKYNTKNQNTYQPRIQIYNGFENTEELFTWFYQEFGKENVSFYPDFRSPLGGCIALIGSAKVKFFNRIHKFLHPSMAYKLPKEFRGFYNGWMETEKQAISAKIVRISTHLPDREQNNRYCITVEHPTHRFFVKGGLVKNCLDVDATLRIYNGLVKAFNNPAFRFRSPITGQLEENNTKTVMQGYLDDIVQLRIILKDMSDRGFPIDINEREKFRKQIELERNTTLDELQDLYPMHLRRVSPLEGYKFVPKEVHELTELFNSRRNFKNKGKWVATDATDEELAFLLSKYIEIKTRPEDDETTGLVIKEFDFQGHKEKRYCRIQKFKPGSPKQVLDYIKYKKYKVPTKRDYKKGERESTSKDLLQPLWEETGDDLILKCIYIRELANMLNTYVGTGKKEGWKVSSDNRVHAEFLFKPSTGQLSTSPNIQNAPSHGTKFSTKGYVKLAQQFRKIVAAGPGKVLVSSDWSAFHINTLAFEAEDAEYMRIGRIDPHSFLSAEIILGNLQSGLYLTRLKASKPPHLTDEEWKAKILKYEEATERLKDFTNWLKVPTEELATNLKWFKKNFSLTRNSMAKPCILGLGFGMGVNKFYKTNRHTFKSKAQPEKIHALMKQRFPKTFVEYPEKIKDLADRQTYLITRYGYIRRFYNVYDWRLLKAPRAPKGTEKIIKTQKGQWWSRKDGDSSKEAIAYLPSNNAFGFKKECMRALWNHPNGNLCKSFGLVNEVHDDLTFEIDESLVNEALPIIKGIMEAPAKYLINSVAPAGLVTKVEVKIGKNWGEMKGIKV